jgi:hypothetical protein
MTRASQAKLAFVAAGLAAWATGVRLEDPLLRWVGTGLIAAAFLMRFVFRDKEPPDQDGED